MEQLISDFTKQLHVALEIGNNASIKPHNNEIRNVVVIGVGGSGIGANIVQEWIRGEIKIPITVNKGYSVPAFINKHTLLIACSFSGNTEETLIALNKIIDSEAKIVVITSGGKISKIANDNGFDIIQIPGESNCPRASLGYSIVQQLFIYEKLGLIGASSIEQIQQSIELLDIERENIQSEAKNFAKLLDGKLPIIYTTERMESVAIRFRQQLNENAKVLAWHHVIPEMNHNELVGWRQHNSDYAVIYLRNSDDYEKNNTRIEINKTIIARYADSIIEIWSKGDSLVEKGMYLIHLCDWTSYYLSLHRGVDAFEVDVINFLKGELAK